MIKRLGNLSNMLHPVALAIDLIHETARVYSSVEGRPTSEPWSPSAPPEVYAPLVCG
jgi:hypothetical protein